jgi:trigger factor
MAATLSTLSGLERRLDISLPFGEVESEVQQRLKRLARTVRMDGFRPGKVPFKVVARQYTDQVRREVLDDALRKSFGDTVREQSLKVAGYPNFEAKSSADPAQQVEFSATFEVYPEIKLGDFSTVSITRPKVDLGDADVDKAIGIMRKQRTAFDAVERAAQSGDRVIIDFAGTCEGREFEGGKANDFVLVLGEGRLLKDFEAQLEGMQAAQDRRFDVPFPADYHVKDLAGKTVSFDVKLKQVSAPRLPELDADFAKSLGVADGNLDTMRKEIRENLEREVEKRIASRLKDQIMQALIDNSQLDVPKSLVRMEAANLMQSARQELQSRGVKLESMPIQPDAFLEPAQRRVKLGLILAELVKAHALQAKPEQVRSMVERHAQNYEHPAEVVKWFYDAPERLGEIESSVLEDNVVSWALATGKVTDQTVAMEELMEGAK